ncbi:sugar phosphate isomerase/epimerase|uniref:Sugar phosphate isomerase/epimerase n=1 Tax=Brenneria salicis ATCC 15712 = DSM 30166 TaxID=714314 RepID=A0A366ICI2_9GAMM|nr:sugar phosphate isomerase/epimerase [Brenneria salicis]NMN92170.1 sugar phosphate isomerase/epimerase [Brenneria salicis ATCC 15712 = DSM 30166]RBP67504.1 sugar phosphate isomerase/epimerase [Brenneria salicis ATCC 15712 = DSM 30166]
MRCMTLLRGFVIPFVFMLSSGFAGAEKPAGNQQIAVQMYTLRNMGTLDEQFTLAREAGYKAVELVGTQGVSASEMKALLAKHQLKAIAAHVQLTELKSNPEEVIAFNKAIGNRVIIVPSLDVASRPSTPTGWQQLGKELNDIGADLKKSGMQLGYHNHNYEMKTYHGKTGLELLFDAAKPENLVMELDVAWASRGGQDPARLLTKYHGRLFSIHAKDNTPVGIRDDERNFAPPGEGLLAWDEIIPAAVKSGAKWFVVEHDLPKDPQAVISAAYRSLSEKLGVVKDKSGD